MKVYLVTNEWEDDSHYCEDYEHDREFIAIHSTLELAYQRVMKEIEYFKNRGYKIFEIVEQDSLEEFKCKFNNDESPHIGSVTIRFGRGYSRNVYKHTYFIEEIEVDQE